MPVSTFLQIGPDHQFRIQDGSLLISTNGASCCLCPLKTCPATDDTHCRDVCTRDLTVTVSGTGDASCVNGTFDIRNGQDSLGGTNTAYCEWEAVTYIAASTLNAPLLRCTGEVVFPFSPAEWRLDIQAINCGSGSNQSCAWSLFGPNFNNCPQLMSGTVAPNGGSCTNTISVTMS